MLLLHFLRLVRFGNLLVIGVTMCIIQAFIGVREGGHVMLNQLMEEEALDSFNVLERILISTQINFNFFLLMLSVILIAAAGNIINDYFDVKADRVNKPEKMVIDKYIKRRWAIVWNWVFNGFGLLIAMYLAWQLSNWWIAIIAFLTINFLWFYSAVYKRKIIVGNIIVAILVGIVPVYVLIYNFPITGFELEVYDSSVNYGSLFLYEVVFTISIIAFVINLMREIIKDMADVRGDMKLAARTVPIALGFRRTKTILTAMLIPLLLLMAYYIFNMHHYVDLMEQTSQPWKNPMIYLNELGVFTAFVITSGSLCIISFAVLLTSHNRKRYLISSNLLKLAMLFGMVSPLFL